ncbi:hypothetical protein L596_004385 [Steinernema carpocapsae]|uniref:Uncharacterized protein n=1 Tax=Steinernema carpocapsae TaxID=34508 RepID=A0A4U8UVR1_STECR|nr:hypothetical protein L596_004385 [Steinernema carpocapsae]
MAARRAARSALVVNLLLLSYTLGQIVPVQPGHGPCIQRPSNCHIDCPHGYLWGVGATCLCICQLNPCLSKVCNSDETCVLEANSPKCVPQIVGQKQTAHTAAMGECPTLVGGPCVDQCQADSDCGGQMRCCRNGCGHECIIPVTSHTIRSQLPIKSISSSKLSTPFTLSMGKDDKPGECPDLSVIRERRCVVECNKDSDCPSVTKCCNNGCGQLCTAPEKASACIHLLSSIERLPDQKLSNDYVPVCSNDGLFDRVQCNSVYCWCVERESGREEHGTKVFREERQRMNCDEPRRCTEVECLNQCPYGFKTQQNGCPATNCECKNICDDVRCENVLDACQLVEPDCANPPCLPVPRCLLNPCSNGLPMTLPNGVTALCTQSNQCSQNYWCHQIGYNGLGFCCPAPEAAARDGFCESRTPRHLKGCSSECRVDVDCKPTSKCCFDGCGLKCMEVNFSPNPFQYRPSAKIITTVDIAKSNKEILSRLISECPEPAVSDRITNCENKCKADTDCPGMKLCCSSGCSRVCAYPKKTTPCIYQAISAELYSLRSVFKCNAAGNFDSVQCDEDRCYCVNVQSGIEIPDTWVPLSNEPNCKDVRNPSCPILSCVEDCPHGYERNGNGCPTCTCRNPCNELHCPQGNVCVLSEVDCFQKSNCPPQPRCESSIYKLSLMVNIAGVLNFCAGQPYTGNSGQVAQCDSECPQGYWCNNVGMQGKGLCCPAPEKMPRAGRCPKKTVLLEQIDSCKVDCRSDDDCQNGHKCCYDGCGTACLQTEGDGFLKHPSPSTETASPNLPSNKVGVCVAPQGSQDCEDLRNQCVDDSDCPSIQKCCFDGCVKRCSFAQRTTGCLHMKAAFAQLGIGDFVKCNKDGDFAEVQCDRQYCWCVGTNGREAEGTRVSNNLTPDCHSQRYCASPICPPKSCLYGFEKDSNGCSTCECSNPCKNVACSNFQICVPHPVECLGGGPCLPVPRCIINACPQGSPVIDTSTFEPVFCRENGQCRQGTYCRAFKNNGGYCCPLPEVESLPGSCPKVPPNPSARNCGLRCKSDAQCGNDDKCCFDGCGLSCVGSEQRSPVRTSQRKIGNCPKVEDLGNTVCGSERVDSCDNDSPCPSMQKCCFDGCANTCQYPAVTTLCLHSQASGERLMLSGVSNTPQVQCTVDGAFAKVQLSNGFSFCVNNLGREISGTRTSSGIPNCQQPRSCPLTACTKHCAFGFETTNQGCETCVCHDPCRGVECPANHVCRVSSVECFETECTPLPKCILNACPTGEPLERVDTRQLAECDDLLGKRCPYGWFCHKFGLEDMGYCCQGTGNVVTSSEVCPKIIILATPRPNTGCSVECRLNSDCHGNGPCCFNGCGMSCRKGSPKTAPSTSIQKSISVVPAIVPQNQLNAERLGVCSSNPISNPGCRSDCTRDSECPEFQKCCAYGCGRLCQYPRVATACVHRLAAFASLKTVNPIHHVQCTSDGLFRSVQCDQSIHVCWCVETSSGLELPGTRLTSLGKEPSCNVHRLCPTKCTEKTCEHGVKLDRTGCPLNGFCECRNPCEDFQCPKSSDVCVLKTVDCISQPCPSVPTCQSNPCIGGLAASRDANGNVVTCSRDNDCGRGQCKILPGDSRLGVCCPREHESVAFLSSVKLGECPNDIQFSASECKNQCESDPDCMGMEKCCQYGCSKLCVGPVNATNCIHLHMAIDMLKRSSIPTTLHKPQCDARSGMFTSIQCDDSNVCWCADTVTGNEFYGTRSSGAVNVCSNRKACPISCDDRSTICPFGLDTNKDGCARDSNCRCRNPCDSVQCPKDYTCLLRPRTCRDQTCLPYPTCEKNPCVNNQRPAVEPRTFTQFTCLENRTHICPTGFYCTGYDGHQGICCPGQEPILGQVAAQTTCPHGDAFSSSPDGSPSKCSVNSDGCPSTHYCLSKPGESHGICCVTKRYVCNLELDVGPCSASVPRFYYNSEKQTCQSFNYGGCSGNLNNFGTEFECEHFCKGTGVDPTNLLMDDYGHVVKDIYQMGFSLTGPLLRSKHHDNFNNVFRSYLHEHFGVDEADVCNLMIRDDNSVNFSINTADAKAVSQNISDAVSGRRFEFTYEGDVYRAEPRTWFNHQVAQEESETGTTFMFWVLLVASIVFALIILLSLCVAFTFLQRRPKRGPGSTFRGSTPSQQYVPNVSAYMQDNGDSSSSDSPTGSGNPSAKKVFTTDDFGGPHGGQQSGSGFLQPHWSDTHLHHGAQTRGGRRPSRTTLYY